VELNNKMTTILNNLNFDDSRINRELILSIIKKITEAERGKKEIIVQLIPEEVEFVHTYNIEPPPLSILYQVIEEILPNLGFDPFINTDESNQLIIKEQKQ